MICCGVMAMSTAPTAELTSEDMMRGSMIKRPEPGATTVREIKVKVCAECGCMLDDTGMLCDYECSQDGDEHKNVITAVYERTDKFLRDE